MPARSPPKNTAVLQPLTLATTLDPQACFSVAQPA